MFSLDMAFNDGRASAHLEHLLTQDAFLEMISIQITSFPKVTLYRWHLVIGMMQRNDV
jgi:hypothetical protein